MSLHSQKIIRGLYRLLYKRRIAHLREALIRSKPRLGGVSFGRNLIVEGTVDVGDSTNIVLDDRKSGHVNKQENRKRYVQSEMRG